MNKRVTAQLCAQLLALQNLCAWGVRGHTLANLAAVESIPQNGPVFLKPQKAYIATSASFPTRGAACLSLSCAFLKTRITVGTQKGSILYLNRRAREPNLFFAFTTNICA